MPIIKLIKEKVVAEDIELGMGDIVQNRGTGSKFNSSLLPYSDTETTTEAIDRKADLTDLDVKMDKAGGTFTGPVSGPYPTALDGLANVKFVLDRVVGKQPIEWKGYFTPTVGAEYPLNPEIKDGWIIDIPEGTTYTFQTGELAGRVAEVNDALVYGENGWFLTDFGMVDGLYYKLDGTDPITAHFNAGGYKLTSVQAGSDDADAVNVGQVRGLLANYKLTNISDVNTGGVVDGDVLTWDGTLGLWTAGTGVPPTDAPILSESSVSMVQNETVVVTINNYSSTATYTVSSSDSAVATATQVNGTIEIVSADVTADGSAVVSVMAKEPDLTDSPTTTVDVSVTYVPFVEDTIINSDFQTNAYYVDGFNF